MMKFVREGLAVALCLCLALPVGAASPLPEQQEVTADAPKYKIEILTAAGKVQKRRQGMVSSESVIRVTDENDTPVAGVTVTFLVTQLSGGQASFINGTGTNVLTTNAQGIASTGPVTASPQSTFNLVASVGSAGQATSATIPVSMAAVAAGVATGAAISATAIALIAVGAAAAVGVAVAAGGGGNGGSPSPGPTPLPGVRIGVGGAPTIGPPR
jgi:hypothetical protein